MKLFFDGIMDQIRQTMPTSEKLSDDQLFELLQKGKKKAESYDITGRTDLTDYLLCVVRYGLDFDKDDDYLWARVIFSDQKTTGAQKMDRIMEMVTAMESKE